MSAPDGLPGEVYAYSVDYGPDRGYLPGASGGGRIAVYTSLPTARGAATQSSGTYGRRRRRARRVYRARVVWELVDDLPEEAS